MGVHNSGRSNRRILEIGPSANREMVLPTGHQLDKEDLMKKYAIAILGILLCMCGYLAYRLGGANCRRAVAEETTAVHQLAERNVQEIRTRVHSTDSSDNLEWLCKHWKRAD